MGRRGGAVAAGASGGARSARRARGDHRLLDRASRRRLSRHRSHNARALHRPPSTRHSAPFHGPRDEGDPSVDREQWRRSPRGGRCQGGPHRTSSTGDGGHEWRKPGVERAEERCASCSSTSTSAHAVGRASHGERPRDGTAQRGPCRGRHFWHDPSRTYRSDAFRRFRTARLITSAERGTEEWRAERHAPLRTRGLESQRRPGESPAATFGRRAAVPIGRGAACATGRRAARSPSGRGRRSGVFGARFEPDVRGGARGSPGRGSAGRRCRARTSGALAATSPSPHHAAARHAGGAVAFRAASLGAPERAAASRVAASAASVHARYPAAPGDTNVAATTR